MSIKSFWTGRVDGTEQSQLRWHQIVKDGNEVKNFADQFVLLGFESDEGVKRNKGRTGAKDAPNEIRSCMGSFPAWNLSVIYDLGNISCDDEDLENAQNQLIKKLSSIYERNGKSIVMGGGHEVTFPHYEALEQCYPDLKIGIINFDAHFDNRPIDAEIGATSGTGFSQIAKAKSINSLHIGIQKNSNTKALFEYAHETGMKYILASDFYNEKEKSSGIINNFINEIDVFYLTICMDVFSSAFAPGVSATAYNGILPDSYFQNTFSEIIQSKKLKAFDIAEVNPKYDIDKRTSKLAGSFIFEVMQLNS